MNGMHHPSATAQPIQRRITLLRHADAVADERGDDHARVLSAQGQASAQALGRWMQENHLPAGLVLCSTATRTRQTLDALGMNLPTLLLAPLYLASAGEMLAQLQQMDDTVAHIMLVGHNPGIHGLAALLAKDYVRDADADALAQGFPTAGLVSMGVPLAQWRMLQPHSATLDLLRFS